MSLNRKYDIPSVVDNRERTLNSFHSCHSDRDWRVYDSSGSSLLIDETLLEKLETMRYRCEYDVSFSFIDPDSKKIGFYYRFGFYWRGEFVVATLEYFLRPSMHLEKFEPIFPGNLVVDLPKGNEFSEVFENE